ncbi:MAG TPA: aminopeptidase [Rhodanobacteraceae bacterium]|nr:aminopeptidase [Rhodanobacteraceae bacterium]
MGYYVHVAQGEATLLAHRRAITGIVNDPKADAHLRTRLAQTQEARTFASDRLLLPRNPSYTTYVDLGRPYVTWNVFATPEFSVDPVTHCFPFAGCVAYVGFFDRSRAEQESKRLAENGDDTAIEGAAAYSTLGWFSDPIVSTMMRWSDDELDGVIFHELAHQLIYVEDDTAFNESFATFVQQEGVREWRASRGLPPPDLNESAHDDAFTALILDLRSRLSAVYVRESTATEKRAAKEREIDDFRERYRRLRDSEWSGDTRYDGWLDGSINNARLVPFGLYDQWVPAFKLLFMQARGEWKDFYALVRELAGQKKEERRRRLDVLLANASPNGE